MTPSTSESPQEVKARGAYYTPAEISTFIARWAIRDKDDVVLEPSCGDGSFLTAAAARFLELGQADLRRRLIGAERSAEEAAKSAALVPGADVRQVNFFDLEPDQLEQPADTVIGNPPYIRYHGFTGEDREKGLARATAVGVELTRLASSWAHFVVHATGFLAPDGRLGLVLPAELLVTDYAQPVRAHLLARFSSVTVVAFDQMVFDDAQVDAVLLLASNDSDEQLKFVRVGSPRDLADLDVLLPLGPANRPVGRWSVSLDLGAETTYRALAEGPRTRRLSEIASVDIGVVTGANRFFVMSAADAARRALPDSVLVPVVERPGDLTGLVVREEETRRLLRIPPGPAPDVPALTAYLREGQDSHVDRGYKCRVRRHWYSVPLPRTQPDAFLPYMNGDVPRLIVAEGACWSTNLVHGVKFSGPSPSPRAAAASMLSSVTLLSAEVEGRAYGGGVLKLETREAERLLVPDLTRDEEALLERAFPELDLMVREGQLMRASRLVDAMLGIDGEPLERARLVFRTRRRNRGTRNRTAPS